MAYEKQTWETGQVIGDTKLNHIEEGIEMANSNYEKTVWNTGDVITAEKLNKIEEGIENISNGVEVTVEDGVATGYKFAVTIPDGVTEIGENAFKYCDSLTSVTIPDSVTIIGIGAFSNCRALTSVTIPDGVTEISDYAFDKCYSLASVIISDGVTKINDYAFCDCQALTDVTMMPTTPPLIGEGAFNGASDNLVIYVPAESVDAYKVAPYYWRDYADKIQPISAPA